MFHKSTDLPASPAGFPTDQQQCVNQSSAVQSLGLARGTALCTHEGSQIPSMLVKAGTVGQLGQELGDWEWQCETFSHYSFTGCWVSDSRCLKSFKDDRSEMMHSLYVLSSHQFICHLPTLKRMPTTSYLSHMLLCRLCVFHNVTVLVTKMKAPFKALWGSLKIYSSRPTC